MQEHISDIGTFKKLLEAEVGEMRMRDVHKYWATYLHDLREKEKIGKKKVYNNVPDNGEDIREVSVEQIRVLGELLKEKKITPTLYEKALAASRTEASKIISEFGTGGK